MKSLNQNQVRSTVARLLSTENITVRHGNYSTAFFDVKSRLLGLPIWKDCSKEVYDMLIGHEVGHALFTPPNSLDQVTSGRRKSYLNIVEDIRIERMIQQKYPGLVHAFGEAYAQLWDQNFFQVKHKNLNKLSFPDRINIQAKCSDLVNISFTKEEQKIYDQCQAAKTFRDVELAVDAIEKYMKDVEEQQKEQQNGSGQKQKSKKSNQPREEDEDPTGGSDDEGGDESQENEDTNGNSDEKSSGGSGDSEDESDDADLDEDSGDGQGESDDEESEDEHGQTKSKSKSKKSKTGRYGPADIGAEGGRDGEINLDQSLDTITMDAFEKAVQNLVDLSAEEQLTARAVAPRNSEIDALIKDYKTVFAQRDYDRRLANKEKEFLAFLKTTQSFINLLVKEFEMRKAASQYLRASQAKTGTINVNRLHAYKYDDDIFKSVTVLANAKNHGLMMFVDYSSSMTHVISDVYKQVINISLFCRSCGIPFDVYGFTDGHYTISSSTQEGRVHFGSTRLVQVASSSMSKANFNKAIFHLWGMANHSLKSPLENLGGTPLNETLIAAHNLIERFKLRYKVEKMTCLVVSDGAGGGLQIGIDPNLAKHSNGRAKPSIYGTSNWTQIEMNLAGRTIRSSMESRALSRSLVKNLHDALGVRTLCFYITTPDHVSVEVQSAISAGLNKNLKHAQLMERWKVEKLVHVPGGHHYDDYFVIGNSMKVDDSTFAEKSTNGTAEGIAKEFLDFALNKRFSRAFAVKFAEAIR